MLTKQNLVNAVIWPNGPKAAIALFDTSDEGGGEQVALVPITVPKEGREIAKMIPEGFSVDVEECTVVKLSGPIIKGTKGKFDTAVVTERPEVTFEDRMARLERITLRREKAQKARMAELEAAAEELAAIKAKESAEAVKDAEEPIVEPTVEPGGEEAIADETTTKEPVNDGA